MGLDMYMHKIEKLTENESLAIAGITTSDLRTKYHYIDKESFDADPDMYSDLIPFVREIPVIETFFDCKACFTERGIVEGDDICGSFCAHDQIGWFFASGAKIEISRQEYEKYLYEAETLVYVFKSEQVAYWRKYYDLDEFLETARIVCRTKQFIEENGVPPKDEDIAFWKTENCGYYMLGLDEKLALKKYLAENETENDRGDYHPRWNDLLDDENSVLMYHAWW